MKKYVKSPITTDYLTEGKEYEIIEGASSKTYFSIICDSGRNIFCLYKECLHLNNKNWIKIK